MGLDGVELIMEVEDTFGISIPDEEAEYCSTVGGMYNIIISKLTPAEEGCLSNSAFYKLRKAMIDEFNFSRKEIRPKALLHGFFPEKNRRSAWKSLQERLNLQLPCLRRPTMIHVGIFLSSLMVGLTAGIYSRSIFIFITAFLFAIIIAYMITKFLATEFPKPCTTIGGTVNNIVALNFKTLREEKSKWHHNEVWRTLLFVISDQLGIDENELTPETNFVKDLNVG